MSKVWKIGLCVCVCMCTSSLHVEAEDAVAIRRGEQVVAQLRNIPRGTAPARNDPSLDLGKNIRLVLLVQRMGSEPLSISVVTAGRQVSLNALAGMAEIDGNAIPVMMKFDASIEPLDDGEYLVSYDLATSRPVVTAVTSTAGAVQKSSFQYQKMGVEASARMRLNKAMVILKNPDEEISLELQSVGE